MSILYPIIAFTIGFILVYLSIPTIINVSRAKHLYDEPNERTASQNIVPTLGGVAIFIGLTISTIISTNGYSFNELKYLIAAIIIMLFIGLKDDILILSARKKLYIQILTSLILVVLGNFRFTSFHGILGIHEINYATSVFVSCFTIIVLVNAFNLIDGIDGLASGVSILTASVFGIWFLLAGHYEYGILCLGFVGSLVAFFIYNVFGKSNKIFMGDTGSLILGTTMSVIVIKFNEFNINTNAPYAISAAPAVSIGFLIVPVIDTLRVFFIRISERRSPFSPDMNHIHHKLLKLGNSHLKSTIIITSANAIFILLSLVLSTLFEINSLLLIIFTLGLAVGYLPSYILKYQRNEINTFPGFDLQQNPLLTKSFRFPSVFYTTKIKEDSYTIQLKRNGESVLKEKKQKV
jgi:UDP-N-acetylmuramyl pentapeptide phosphotransferase/UDP-N-acetylglucosamine-1-phosphate transferase